MTEAVLEDLLRDLTALSDPELQHLLERWAYLLPEEKMQLVAVLDDLLSDRGSQ
jgi:hypothetical protein